MLVETCLPQTGGYARDTILSLLNRGAPVHLVGAGGVGMAGLAVLLRARGLRVSGCDNQPGRFTRWLESKGIPVMIGHDPTHLADGVDWVIRSTAVPDEAPELVQARRLGLPVVHRGCVLPRLLDGRVSVAVSGTHGKTTTSTFIALLLTRAGLAPDWAIGGEVPLLGGVAGCGDGSRMVVEADESDGTLSNYAPSLAVITNIEFDHMEHFADVQAFERCFESFADQAGKVIYGADDRRASRLMAGRPGAVGFGFSEGALYRAVDIRANGSSQQFGLERGGQRLGGIRLPMPGRHNVLNALAALAVCLEWGVPFDVLAEAADGLALPGRRFERVTEAGGVAVFSDYAHHPSEVAALVRMVRDLPYRRRVVVYQPHRYTRTLALKVDFPPAFEGVDELILAPVYGASEPPLAGGMIQDLYAAFRSSGTATAGHVYLADSLHHAWQAVRRLVKRGDALLVVGAGDVEQIARWAGQPGPDGALMPVTEFPADFPALGAGSTGSVNEPLGPRTTLGVGGCADYWVEAGSEADAVRVLAWAHRQAMPVQVLGGGSNLLVSDLGVRGVVMRLGAGFAGIREASGVVCIGAGTSLATVERWMVDRGWSGLEFLGGIPATVGGCLRMNAGAWGHSIAECVEWIRCLKPDGSVCIVARDELDAGYRSMGALTGCMAVEAGLRLTRVPVEQVRESFAAARTHRRWMMQERTAGSVFRNPPGGFAGALIEQAGLKGCRVGGARISEQHANVVVAERAATASDVRALILQVQDRVLRTTGVSLEPEIVWMV
ncbi:MAG: hypothetical protein A2498_03075 [Lentisphaerae bacterium RIFOXYC12_FULL_60_16]|nr:MAG: hypothetical protein A2498_03075 [Lentisphaerae bacterium RIFOXYC12_FULL_60_16]